MSTDDDDATAEEKYGIHRSRLPRRRFSGKPESMTRQSQYYCLATSAEGASLRVLMWVIYYCCHYHGNDRYLTNEEAEGEWFFSVNAALFDNRYILEWLYSLLNSTFSTVQKLLDLDLDYAGTTYDLTETIVKVLSKRAHLGLGVLPMGRSRWAVSKTGLGLVRSVLVAEIWSIYWFEVVVVVVWCGGGCECIWYGACYVALYCKKRMQSYREDGRWKEC